MKKKKFLVGVIVALISLFIVNVKANATAPESFTVNSLGSIDTKYYLPDNFDGGVWIHTKKNNLGEYVYCIEINKTSGNSAYKLKGELPSQFAYVLANGYPKKSIFGSADKDYFTTALAIWYFSKSYSDANVYNNIFDDFNFTNGTYKGKSSDIVKAVADLINKANNYSYANPTMKINSSNNSFTLSSDGKYYVSSNIAVTTTGSVGKYTVSLSNAPKGTIITDTNNNEKNTFAVNENFIVKVPVSSINSLSYAFTVGVSAVGSIYKAYMYSPDNTSYQSVAALYKEEVNLKDNTDLNLKLTTEVQISKTDATTGEELPGATLVLKCPNGKEITWVSTNEAHIIKGLEPGKYTLTEKIAPDGYILSEETIEFEIKADGTVTKVEMKNYPEEKPFLVYISKQDVTTGEELAGAYLELYNENNELVEAWISTDEVHIIEGLKPGKYTLKETIAPDGYELSSETVEFTVKEDGTVDGKVIMYNKPAEVVEVPSTSSFKTITASLIGIVIIGLGAMVIYKNYKKNEEK